MSEIKTKIRTYNDVIDLFGEEKAADMLSEALDWSTIDPKNDKMSIMERKPLLLDPYMTYEGEDYCKHIVAGFLGDRDLDWASGYIDEEKIKNGQVMPSDLKSALSMALDNELSTSWAYLDALSSQCAEICNKFAGYIESAGYTQNELVDMIGREDNGEDFVITGVGAGHYVGTCKKEPSKNKSVSGKTCNARESSGRLDADRNVDRNDIAKDKEVK